MVKAPRISVAANPACRGIGEVTADDHDISIRIALKKGEPRLAALVMIVAEAILQPRLGALHRMMHDIAGDDRILGIRRDTHADMPGRVTWRRLQPYLRADLMIACDEVHEARVKYRLQ